MVEQPGVAGEKQQAAASPSQLEDPSASQSLPHSVVAPAPTLPSAMSHLNGNVPATSSSQPSLQPSAVHSPIASSSPADRPASSASVAEWCEWLGLYTRAGTKLDSLMLKWSWKDQLSPMQRRLVLGVNSFFLLLYFGGLIISAIEGWALQDGINYILSSCCTLGYGLYTPITTGGRIFMYVYWPVGFIVISSTSTTIWRVMLARVDRILRDHTEKLVKGEKVAVTKRPARRAAPQRADGSESDDEIDSNGALRQNLYPARKDIVFNSPSHQAPPSSQQPAFSPNSHPITRMYVPTEDTHKALSLAEHDKSVDRSPASVGGNRADTAEAESGDTASSFTTPQRRSSSHTRHTSEQMSGHPVRRFSLFDASDRAHRGPYTPTASYPLTWGRGNLSLTVYEANRESTPQPSLADIFAPLHTASPATALPAQPVSKLPAAPAAATTPASSPHLSRSIASQRPPELSVPSTPNAIRTPTPAPAPSGHNKGVRSSNLTMVPSALRDDFLAHLRQPTSHEQLRRVIRQRRHSVTSAQPEQQPAAHRLSAVYEDEDGVNTALPPVSPQSSASSQPSPLPRHPLQHPPPASLSTPSASAALGLVPLSTTHPSLRTPPASLAPPPLFHELAPLLVKLGIAVLAVICWICLAGGVFVWSEGGTYGYWDSQWSAFNLLTTISVGSIATPFSTKTSAFFVWYLLLGVGTLAYCFALIAQLAFIAFDKREATRSLAHLKAATGHSAAAAQSKGGQKRAARQEEEGFVAHAKELDSLILQLVQKQAAAIESEEDAEKQHQAFMRYPVLMFGGEAASGEQVEVPLEGVSLLLRYHLAFQAFEKERARMNSIRQARAAARQGRQQSGRRIVQLNPQAAPEDGADANDAALQQAGADGEGGADGVDAQADGGDEHSDEDVGEEDEEKLVGNGPSDRYFDWSNDRRASRFATTLLQNRNDRKGSLFLVSHKRSLQVVPQVAFDGLV